MAKTERENSRETPSPIARGTDQHPHFFNKKAIPHASRANMRESARVFSLFVLLLLYINLNQLF